LVFATLVDKMKRRLFAGIAEAHYSRRVDAFRTDYPFGFIFGTSGVGGQVNLDRSWG
jgi:hypothetical protein